MTLDQFLAAQGRTYVRARGLQKHMNDLADNAAACGSEVEAGRLRRVGERVWEVADRYIETMFERVQ